MKLFDCPVPVYGDQKYRGDCPAEAVEQVTFFNRLRREYPDTYGRIALHPRNEGQLRDGQHQAMIARRAEGMALGAADIVIPGAPAFVCEIKRRDHTKSAWQDGQREYLAAAKAAGAFVCVALGADAAREALNEWLGLQPQER